MDNKPTDKGWIDFEFSELDKARFWIKATQTKSCWEWVGSLNSDGYGTFRVGRDNTFLAHRVAYYLIKGKIGGHEICHRCDNPKCVNPSHLFSGTHADNTRDMTEKGRGRYQGKTSKYVGVGRRSDSGFWRAFICVNSKGKNIGTFKTELEAATFRDKYIIENKLTQKLNFPLPSPPNK